jgi:hypothetical protein
MNTDKKSTEEAAKWIDLLLLLALGAMALAMFACGCAAPKYEEVPGPSQFQTPKEASNIQHRTLNLEALPAPGKSFTERNEAQAGPAVTPRVIVLSAPAFQYPWFSFSCVASWDLQASSNLVTWQVFPTNRYQVIGSEIYVTNDFPRMFFRVRLHC